MKLEVKNMYGLNGKEMFSLDSSHKHNFIYGINASGKSSIANAVMHLLNKDEYEKRFPYDSDDYVVRLEFDDIIAEYNQNVKIEEIEEISRKVFVFNKNFIKNSLSINSIEGQGITPEIGIRVSEKNALIERNNKILETNVKSIKKELSNMNLPTTQKALYDGSLFKAIYGKDQILQKKAWISIANLQGKAISDLTSEDFKNENIELFKLVHKSINELSEELVAKLLEKAKEGKYKIENKETIEFYEQAVKYLNKKEGTINCPICLSNEIDVEQVKTELIDALKEIKNNDAMKKIKECYEKITKFDSFFSELAINICEGIMSFAFPNELIEEFDKKFDMFLQNYDYNIMNYSKLQINQTELEEVNNNEKTIEKIEKENEKISNSGFIVEFDKMLNYIFSDNEIRAQAQLLNKTVTIQLIIKGKEKEGKSIEEFFDIISESQKTKLSLAFFFSLIIYKNLGSSILCIFDDPVDSYDSISKYKISRILYEFIEKKSIFENYEYDCHSIFMSHSVEYFRLFINNFRRSIRKEIGYYIFSKKLSEITYDDIFMIEGDYNILDKLINKQQPKKIEEFLSILPILRELTNYSYKILNTNSNNLTIGTYKIEDTSKYISNNIIHGFDCNVTLDQLLTEVRKIIVIDLESNDFSGNDEIFKIIDNIILSWEERISSNSLSFREEIVLKNILALYIRAFYDSVLLKIIKNYVTKYRGKTIEEIKNDNQLWTINNKISVIYADKSIQQAYKDICVKISVDLTMLNDFGHSAGIYMTPLIDVDINDLYKIYKEINKDDSVYAPIIALA